MGSTHSHLVAKMTDNMVRLNMSALLVPWRFGFGVRGGGEAVTHTARYYVCHLPPGYALVNLNFKNAFNLMHKYRMLKVLLDSGPRIYHFVFSIYSTPSFFF